LAKNNNTALFVLVGVILAVFFISQLKNEDTPMPTPTPQGSSIQETADIDVFSDLACTQKLTSFTWGTLTPSSMATKDIYVKNTGNMVLILGLSVDNWQPSAASVISVTWDREGAVLVKGAVVEATLTLSVPSDISGVTDFSNRITISGSAMP